jgi:hypothetical protein
LSGRPAPACHCKIVASFLNGKPSYLLYFWELADAHQLLQSSLQRLNSSTGASGWCLVCSHEYYFDK